MKENEKCLFVCTVCGRVLDGGFYFNSLSVASSFSFHSPFIFHAVTNAYNIKYAHKSSNLASGLFERIENSKLVFFSVVVAV